MVLSNRRVEEQLRLGEDSLWEFKRIEFRGDRPISPRRDELADEIASLANTSGGVLVCGATDRGEVHGMSREQMDALEPVIFEACSNSIKPPINVVVTRRSSRRGRPFLVVEVPEGYAQHDSPGGSYVRAGSSKRRMASDERLRLAQRRAQSRFVWFDKQVVPETGFGTLSKSLWKRLLSDEGRKDPRVALAKMGLLSTNRSGELVATVAGVLLCCEAPEEWLPNACITATCYRGRDRTTGQVDSATIVGPVTRQVADAMRFAKRNTRVAAHKQPARVDLPQYSQRAIFEALVNAVAHRDYSIRGSRIRLSMFEDRLELQSPGGLASNLTLESMALRQATRNELLASILGRSPVGGIPGSEHREFFMERRGDGIPIILRETRQTSGREATFRLVDETDFVLEIPAAQVDPSPADVVVTVLSGGKPVVGADILVVFPNNAWRRAMTNDNGEANAHLHSTHLPLTVLVATDGFCGHVEKGWVPAKRALVIELATMPGGGATIFAEGGGSIPGLAGRLHPTRDTFGRNILYAINIAINEGERQPVSYGLGESLRLADADSRVAIARILEIAGRSAIVEYRPADEPA